MAIVIGCLVSWLAIIAFSLAPKTLTTFEMIFVFFTDTIFELSVFSILHLNLKLIEVAPSTDAALADLMFRLIELPTLLLLASNLLLYKSRFVRVIGILSIVLFTMLVQTILVRVGLLTLHHWNVLYSGVLIVVDIAFSRLMTWVIMRASAGGDVNT